MRDLDNRIREGLRAARLNGRIADEVQVEVRNAILAEPSPEERVIALVREEVRRTRTEDPSTYNVWTRVSYAIDKVEASLGDES